MSFLDTLLIDGNDIRGITGLSIVGAIRGFWAPGERRGVDDPIPGRDGELGARLPLAAYTIEIPIQIVAASRGERDDLLLSLGSLIGGRDNDGLVTLERHRATSTGGSHLTTTARGRYLTGLNADVVNPHTGRATLQYKNLSGGWFTGTATLYP